MKVLFHFDRDFDYTADRKASTPTLAYLAGMELEVDEATAVAAETADPPAGHRLKPGKPAGEPA